MTTSNLEVLRTFLIQLIPNWTACSSVVLLHIQIMHRWKPRTILPFFATKYIDFTSSVCKYSVWFWRKESNKNNNNNKRKSYNQSMDLLSDDWLKLTFKFAKAQDLCKLNLFSIMSAVDMYPYWINQSNLLFQWQWNFCFLVMVFSYFNS